MKSDSPGVGLSGLITGVSSPDDGSGSAPADPGP